MKTLKNVLCGMSIAFCLASSAAGMEHPSLSVSLMFFCVVCAAAAIVAELVDRLIIRYGKKAPARELSEQATELPQSRVFIEIINREGAKNDIQSGA